ncbi:MAG: NAD-dependent epimerase/dehydratase family protein, partial [Verrucomicrobiota bacterium]
MKTILIAGCGYVGRVALSLFQQAGWQVTALTRTPASARAIESTTGCRSVACDLTQRGDLEALRLPGFDAVIDCVSAGASDTEEYRRVYFEGANNLIEVLKPERLLFTSSSSVYGQDDGSRVSEESPALPETGTGLVLRSTEELVLAHGGMVTRFTGIYGPG